LRRGLVPPDTGPQWWAQWWAHREYARINIELTIIPEKAEEILGGSAETVG